MYCHLLYVNKQFLINDELLLEKSNQESGPFLIPLVVVPIGTTTSAISNSPSGSSIRSSPMQNYTDFGTSCFSTPQPNIDVSS